MIFRDIKKSQNQFFKKEEINGAKKNSIRKEKKIIGKIKIEKRRLKDRFNKHSKC